MKSRFSLLKVFSSPTVKYRENGLKIVSNIAENVIRISHPAKNLFPWAVMIVKLFTVGYIR